MKFLKIKKSLNFLNNLKFAIGVLGIIAIISSLGSVIEQDQPISFYEKTYLKPIYGFIDANLILTLGLDHVYTTFWFLSLLFILALSLTSCTITRQFPLVTNSKEYFFKKKKNSYLTLPFSVKFINVFYLKELVLLKIQKMNFYLYQTQNLIYGYKGLIGRLSPILVHISLVTILGGSALGAFKNFKAQEMLPKGEIFHIQNPIAIGSLTSLPNISSRINDFWVEYEDDRIRQFYSNLSILDNLGNEIKEQTISVNNPLRYKNVDFYQSDWNILGIRIKNVSKNEIYELPVFKLKENTKGWLTFLKVEKETYSLVFNNLENIFSIYDGNGKFIMNKSIGEVLSKNWIVIDIISSTGLLVKYDPSIPIIYTGFALLMITTILSYLSYTQIWIFSEEKNSWIGGSTNRGKLQLEIDFENLIRDIENNVIKSPFVSKKK
jgi:cytochrome c biogenesis protein